jgi:succinylglutamate desuccinylase
MDKAFELFKFSKIYKKQKNIEKMTKSNDFNLIFPGKWEKSKLNETIRKNKQIQNLRNFVRKTRAKRYFLQV